MSNEAYASISNRVMSLEDIIRQQEQTIGAVLQRLRDVEQYAAAEARTREQAQQQLYQLLGERGGSSAEAAQQMQAILQNQNERLGSLQAEVQGQAAALRGLDDKYGAALRGVEQRLQSDVGGVHQRAQTGEAATTEAMRALQAQLQGVANTTQAVDARSRDDLVALQQQIGAELSAQRQRTDNLENAIRDALRDVHGSLTGEVRSADTQHRSALDGAVQRLNQAVEALDQRTRADMNQLHAVEQGDVNELSRRIEELERNLREMIQASANGLAAEVTQVAQHSQSLDRRQAAAHQTLLQELAKHDGQLESVDLNWRASVTDLGAVVRESVAGAQQQAAAGDQALQRQLKALEDRVTAAAEGLERSLQELRQHVQEDCVRPVNEVQRVLSAQEQRLARVGDEYAVVQESLKTFAARVDQDASQFRQVVEAAVRASHADLLERINFTSAAITMQLDPETFRVEVNRALAKLWDEAKGVFLTQRSLSEVEAQLATLESAVRVELCALAERHNDVQRSVDTLRIAQQRSAGESPATEKHETHPITTTAAEKGQSAASAAAPPTPALVGHETVPAKTSPKKPRTSSTPILAGSPVRRTSSAQTGQSPLPPPLPPLQAFTFEPIRRTPSPRPKVEEIERDDDGVEELRSSRASNSSRGHRPQQQQQQQQQDGRLQQHEQDIKGLRASLNRLRLTQAQEVDRASAVALLRMEDKAAERDAAEASERERLRQSSSTPLVLRDHTDVFYRDAMEQATASSREAQAASGLAAVASQEARSAASDAAESLRAAEAAQNETLKVANELRLALQRVQRMEENVQRRLAELSTKESRGNSELRPKSGGPSRYDSHASVATVFVQRPSSAENDFAAGDAERREGGTEHHSSEDAGGVSGERLYDEEEEPPHARRVSAAAAAQMSHSPKKQNGSAGSRPPSAPQSTTAPKASLQSSQDNILEVPGISKGEVFIVRQEKTDRTTPASLRQKPSFRDQPPPASSPVKASTSSLGVPPAPTKPATPAESELSQPAPRRGSGMSEVLLPTHQFVRKREYNNFKEFTKQEIDAIWVELLNVRRNQGMSKEEVLLQVSQSKEQLLNTVLQIVQRQENETLGMLSSIKVQLMELRNDPSAMREVRVFPIDNGKNLEEFMRAIGGGAGADQASRPPTSSDKREQKGGERGDVAPASSSLSFSPASAARPATSAVVDAATAFKTAPPPPARHAPASAPQRHGTPQPVAVTRHLYNSPSTQLTAPPTHTKISNNYTAGSAERRATPPSARARRSAEHESDTAASSGRSATPLIPQIIPPVVHRRSSLPSKDELTEVFFADIDRGHPPRLFSKPQRTSPTQPAPTSTVGAAPHRHQYAVAAPVNPATVAPASRPAEPASATAQYRPTSLVAPPPRMVLSPRKGSRPSSAIIDASRRLPLGPTSASDVSPHHVVSPYVSTGATPSPLPHTYQVEKEEPAGVPRRYLKEGKSPRNPANNAYHLNPLQGLGANDSANNASGAGGHRSDSPKRTPPRREPGETPPRREDPQEASRKVLEDEPRPHESRPPRYQLLRNSPPRAALPARPLKDTSPEKYQPMAIQEGSDIYYESVEGQRPARRAQRRSSSSADNTPTKAESDRRGVRETLGPGHVYNREDSAGESPSGRPPRTRSHTHHAAAPLSPHAVSEPQYPPLLPPPQPHRSPSVQVLPSKGPIHLGPYNPPHTETPAATSPGHSRGDGEGEKRATDHRSSRPISPASSSQPQPHAAHNPHVYAPQSGREKDVYSTSQSLHASPTPERGQQQQQQQQRRQSPASRRNSPTSGAGASPAQPTTSATSAGAVVPVRVLDGPVNVPSAASVKSQPQSQPQRTNSTTTIRIHPYQDHREL